MSPILKDLTIGDCRLILGDCVEVLPLLPNCTHTVADPPYEDELHASFGSIGRIRTDSKHRSRHNEMGFEGVNRDRAEFAAAMVARTDRWILIFSLAEGVRAWRDEVQANGAKYKTCCNWVKPDSAPKFNGQGPARGFECIVTAWCGPGHSSWNAGGKRGTYTHNVNVGRQGEHPTEKPLTLMLELLEDFTRPGDMIYDPFMGSGTTGLACMRLGRKFVGIESKPKFFDLAHKRLSDAYGQSDLLSGRPMITSHQTGIEL